MNRSIIAFSLVLFGLVAACQKDRTAEEREASAIPSGAASGSEMPRTVVLATDPEASTAKFFPEGGASTAEAAAPNDAGTGDR